MANSYLSGIFSEEGMLVAGLGFSALKSNRLVISLAKNKIVTKNIRKARKTIIFFPDVPKILNQFSP